MEQIPQMRQESRLLQIFRMIFQRLQMILLASDFVFTELITGVSLFLWGLWLAIPYWDTFKTTPTFLALQQLPIPEDIQGLIIMTVGLTVLVALLIEYNTLRIRATFAAMLIWLFLSAMFIGANVRSTATITYPILALSAAWAYLRLTVLVHRQKETHG